MSGGTYCHVRAGTSGRSAANLRYILREQATGTERATLWTRNLPAHIAVIANPEEQRRNLFAYGWMRETLEAAWGQGSRTHYCAILGFEREVDTTVAKRLTAQWAQGCFPLQTIVATLHLNTRFPHVHLWIEARGVDGHKLDLSAANWRQLDERWNRLYAPAFGHAEKEHLARKWDWEVRKRDYRAMLTRLNPEMLSQVVKGARGDVRRSIGNGLREEDYGIKRGGLEAGYPQFAGCRPCPKPGERRSEERERLATGDPARDTRPSGSHDKAHSRTEPNLKRTQDLDREFW